VRVLAVIPARYESTRLPGKPLIEIGSRTMIEWIYRAASACAALERVVVATDHEEIASRVRRFGGEVELTRSDHATGTDRVAEVAQRHPEAEVIVNVQGDQPFVTPQMLSELVAPYLAGEAPDMTTLAVPITDRARIIDPNVVKVVCDRRGRALYFSRSPIPHRADENVAALQHIGLYAFRSDFLLKYAQLDQTPLENCEHLEQLRALEHGYEIRVCFTDREILEINTPKDALHAQKLFTEAGVG